MAGTRGIRRRCREGRGVLSFQLGQTLITAGAKEELVQSDVIGALRRHARGDWGDLTDEDKKLNDQALKDGSRLLSAYHDTTGTKFWIITEADRSATTVLLPSEY